MPDIQLSQVVYVFILTIHSADWFYLYLGGMIVSQSIAIIVTACIVLCGPITHARTFLVCANRNTTWKELTAALLTLWVYWLLCAHVFTCPIHCIAFLRDQESRTSICSLCNIWNMTWFICNEVINSGIVFGRNSLANHDLPILNMFFFLREKK